jgi:hypothetical protein
MTDKKREEFIAWSSTHSFLGGCYLQTQSDGTFIDVDLQYAWESWQASRESLVIELPPEPTVPDEPEEAIDDSFMDGYYAAQGMRNACAQIIKAAGLKVKP